MHTENYYKISEKLAKLLEKEYGVIYDKIGASFLSGLEKKLYKAIEKMTKKRTYKIKF